jgi:hypothetical protein
MHFIPDFNLDNRAAKCEMLEQFLTEIAGEFRAA